MYMTSNKQQKKQLIMSTNSAEFLKDEIRPITPEEIILLIPGSYKEGTIAFQASSFLPLSET
jgi:hypothetical protein